MTTNLQMSARWTVALTALALGCSAKNAPPRPRPEVSEKMKEQFVRVDDAHAAGTGRQVDRGYLALRDPPPPKRSGTYELPMAMLQAKLLDAIFNGASGALPPEVAQKQTPGDFLARIWSLYGPPAHYGNFSYTFVDRKTGILFTAYSAKMGPAYGGAVHYVGPLPPPAGRDDKQLGEWVQGPQVLEVVRRFERMLEAAPLADCALVESDDDGLWRIGARGGKPFREQLSVVDALDYYSELAQKIDPLYPERHIRWLWIQAEPSQRAQRPAAGEVARRSWLRDLERLEKRQEHDPDLWRSTVDALETLAKPLGLDTAENMRRVAGVQKVPAELRRSGDDDDEAEKP